jgi:choline monooxygenase
MDDQQSPPNTGHTPLERASALEPSHYLGEASLAFDQKNILSRGWQVVAPLSALENAGDHIVREIGGAPIIIVRDEAGSLNGFYNICRHRAGPLALCDGKGAKRLRCAYHGWAYDLCGRLKTAPEMQRAEGFDHSDIRLEPIEVEAWGGLVLARTRSGPALEAVIAGIEDLAAAAELAGMRHHHSRTYSVRANWKVYVDNYLEGYHLPFVHPGLTQVVSYPEYKTELAPWWSVQRSPITDPSGPYSAGEALYFFIFPNTMLNILPGRMQTNRVVPDGPDNCHVEFDFYYAPGVETAAATDDEFSDGVQEEDRIICERVQQGLASGVYQPGRLSPDQEAGVWHWQNLLRDAYRDRS